MFVMMSSKLYIELTKFLVRKAKAYAVYVIIGSYIDNEIYMHNLFWYIQL